MSRSQQRGTDGRMWNVNANGTRWRISDASDGLPGCYITDEMRSPAQIAKDEAEAKAKFERDMHEAWGDDCPDTWP